VVTSNWTEREFAQVHSRIASRLKAAVHVHPGVTTFPHHKHIGPQDRLAPSDQPSLGQVLAEIAAWLDQ
jgi:hypothetical protein